MIPGRLTALPSVPDTLLSSPNITFICVRRANVSSNASAANRAVSRPNTLLLNIAGYLHSNYDVDGCFGTLYHLHVQANQLTSHSPIAVAINADSSDMVTLNAMVLCSIAVRACSDEY